MAAGRRAAILGGLGLLGAIVLWQVYAARGPGPAADAPPDHPGPPQTALILPWLWQGTDSPLPPPASLVRRLAEEAEAGGWSVLALDVAAAPVRADPEDDRYLIDPPMIAADGRAFVLPNLVSVERFTLRLACPSATCADPVGPDLDGRLAPYRDLTLLDAALARATIRSRSTPLDGLPDLAAMRDEAAAILDRARPAP